MLILPKLPMKKKLNCIGVLTSGGDAPGMNAAVRAIVRYSLSHHCEVQGILRGYSGIFERQILRLQTSSVGNIIQRGGTILKTDRCAEFHKKSARKEAAKILRDEGMEGLIVIGGDGSFAGAHLLEKETGFPVIGIPGTIDNDIILTDDTIGFDTAVNTAIDAIDRIRDTASSHNRIFLVEVMGHSSGFIALQVGMGGGAETIVFPEQKESLQTVCERIQTTLEKGILRGKTSSIIVVAEGPKAGLTNRIAARLDNLGYPSRVCILGHTQRGGAPSSHDRVLASMLGATAAAYLISGKSNAMVGVQNSKICLVPLSQVTGHKKRIPPELLPFTQTLA